MANCGPIATSEVDFKSLQDTKSFGNAMFDICSDLSARYSNMALSSEVTLSNIREQLDDLHEKVLSWDSDESMIWDRDPEEASEYLLVVNEVRQLTDTLEGRGFNNGDHEHNEILSLAHSILQMTMARLENEFVHLLIAYQQNVEPELISFPSLEEDMVEDYSSNSFDLELVEGRCQAASIRVSEEFVSDLIDPSVILDVQCIAEMMLLSNYNMECCQAYISVRKHALDECLSVLRMEKLSIEEVLHLDWSVLNSTINNWNRAMKLFVRVYLASEKRLCDLIFGSFPSSVIESCFVESTKSSILQVLNFGEAIAIGPPKVERLFRILDMYEVLNSLLGHIESLFPKSSAIVIEYHEVLMQLRESATRTFLQFKNAIRTNKSATAFPGGGIHPLTKYVMNYIKALADYSETLNSLLKDQDLKDGVSSLGDDGERDSSFDSSPLVWHLQSVTSTLESNLNDRSMLYKDPTLQNFFMMNNICYMVQKIKDSSLQKLLGEWIRAQKRKFRQHAMSYERAAWATVISFLKDEGLRSPGSRTPTKTILKQRYKSFNLAFEEVYRTQTAWLISDMRLREDLRISISLKVLQAYRIFTGRYANHLDGMKHREKFIKYSADDLEKYLLDLFEGLPKILH